MPHISKHTLKKSELERINQELLIVFSRAFSSRTKEVFAWEFFTKTERVMFSKRLAIMVMLDQKVPPYHIQQVLKVSPSTIARVSLQIENERAETVLKHVRTNKNFLVVLEKILNSGLPARVGKGRWKRFNNALRDRPSK